MCMCVFVGVHNNFKENIYIIWKSCHWSDLARCDSFIHSIQVSINLSEIQHLDIILSYCRDLSPFQCMGFMVTSNHQHAIISLNGFLFIINIFPWHLFNSKSWQPTCVPYQPRGTRLLRRLCQGAPRPRARHTAVARIRPGYWKKSETSTHSTQSPPKKPPTNQ